MLPKLPQELLNKIVIAIAADEDVLIPRHLGSLARSCRLINEAVRDAKDQLRVEYEAATALVARWRVFKKCYPQVPDIVAKRRYPISSLWLADRGMTAADAPALLNVLKSKALERLVKLELGRNPFGEEGAAAIAAAAAAGGLSRLQELNLSCNQIGDAGVQALASAFAGGACRELKKLFLGGNEIGDAGLIAFAAALEKGGLPKLKKLLLNPNLIGDDGLKALAAAASHGRLAKLKSIDLTVYSDILVEYAVFGVTVFGEEGVAALADAIDKGDLPSLKYLYLHVDDELHEDERPWSPQLRAACERRGVLLNRDLEVDDNGIGSLETDEEEELYAESEEGEVEEEELEPYDFVDDEARVDLLIAAGGMREACGWKRRSQRTAGPSMRSPKALRRRGSSSQPMSRPTLTAVLHCPLCMTEVSVILTCPSKSRCGTMAQLRPHLIDRQRCNLVWKILTERRV